MTVASRATAPDIKGSNFRRGNRVAIQPDLNTEKNEMRVMWIGSLAIVLVLLGAMGINTLITHNTSTGTVETTGQSGTVSPK
jgi:hypothetical protein